MASLIHRLQATKPEQGWAVTRTRVDRWGELSCHSGALGAFLLMATGWQYIPRNIGLEGASFEPEVWELRGGILQGTQAQERLGSHSFQWQGQAR